MTWRRIGIVAGCTLLVWVGAGLGLAVETAVQYAKLNRDTARARRP